MLARAAWTLAALGFAIGAFCGAGPTRVEPNPFGIFFLCIAAFIWFGWRRIRAALGGPGGIFDALSGNYVEHGASGPKVPEQDVTGPRRRDV